MKNFLKSDVQFNQEFHSPIKNGIHRKCGDTGSERATWGYGITIQL